ncbi:B3 domain-containing protein Os01g0234100-like [Bidens hawaiensis]|uniref:B3 domain-containing protein Os01g0234100-like n=1 Tax=Bidens hawaiensis TaxID=980011 RepID=UPI0040497EA8
MDTSTFGYWLIVSQDETCDAQSKVAAYNRAIEVSESLPDEFPGFVKSLCPSHVTSCFCFGVPKKFYYGFMPKQDETIFLVDEDNQEFKVKFIFKKGDFGSGWQRFVIDHKLCEGDALVFQLIEQWKFKVYIVRRVDGPNIDVAPNEMNLGQNLDRTDDINQENVEDQSLVVFDQPGGDHEDSDAPEGVRFTQSVLKFQEIKSIDDFSIVVDGLVLDSLISDSFIIKYYDLCKSQNAYLHENLNGLNFKAAAGMILETVNIADVIRACKVDTARDDLDTWDKFLDFCEDVGMKVGFLRARISKFVWILFKSNELLEAKRSILAKAQENEKTLNKRLCAVRGVIKNLDHEIESLKRNGENLEAVLGNEVNAPW